MQKCNYYEEKKNCWVKRKAKWKFYVISVDSPSPPRQINELNTEKEVCGWEKKNNLNSAGASL